MLLGPSLATETETETDEFAISVVVWGAPPTSELEIDPLKSLTPTRPATMLSCPPVTAPLRYPLEVMAPPLVPLRPPTTLLAPAVTLPNARELEICASWLK